MQLFPVSHWCHQDPSGNKPDTLDIFEDHTLSVKTALTFGVVWLNIQYIHKDECFFFFTRIWANVQSHNHCCNGKRCIFITTSSFFSTVEPLSDVSHLKHLKWSISNPWVIHQTARSMRTACAAGLQFTAQHFFSGRNECVPPRLAERRTRDIFRMTRGAHALKWMTYFISNDRSASFLAHLLLAAPSSLCSAAA